MFFMPPAFIFTEKAHSLCSVKAEFFRWLQEFGSWGLRETPAKAMVIYAPVMSHPGLHYLVWALGLMPWHITWQRGCFWTVQTLRFESTEAASVCMFYLALKSTSTGCLWGVWAAEPSAGFALLGWQSSCRSWAQLQTGIWAMPHLTG